MIRLQEGSDPMWGPFIYDGDESENIKRCQETIFAIAPYQGDKRGEFIEHTHISGNDGLVLATKR